MNNDKVIVTNYRALRDKYGAEALSKIQDGIKKLTAKDKAEGLKTQVIDLSSSSQMTKVKGKAVTDPQNRRAVKAAIDAIYKSVLPDYLMILGAQDVVPFQELENPVYDPAEGDPDRFVPTDLPYACDAAYSQDPTRFIGPTRVVGRLPDMIAAKRPDYILKLLKIAAGRVSRPASDYATHFGITAWEWRESTRKSIEKLFGSGKDAHTSPEKGPDWEDGHLASRAHFINCHGSMARPIFHGQRGDHHYPVAHESRLLTGRVTEGTVVAVECCYGGELYDPAHSGNLMGICYSYLVNGAYGYCGSTTIAYGPPDDNGQADLICQYFMKQVLGGASLGRAMLEARQEFARGAAQLDPYDLKTLIQFNLLGDPSIHAVAKKTGSVPASKGGLAALASERSVNRSDRRRLLARTGNLIQQTQLVAKRLGEKASRPAALLRKLNAISAKEGMRGASIQSFEVASADGANAAQAVAKTVLARMPKPEAFHIIATRQPGAGDGDVAITGVVAREVNGEIVSYKKVVSR